MEEEKNKILKNKGGRPVKYQNKPIKKLIGVHFTENEYNLAKKNLEFYGYNKFTYLLRDVLLKKKIHVKKHLFLSKESEKIVMNIGNNINQIAKVLNDFNKNNNVQILIDYQNMFNDFNRSWNDTLLELKNKMEEAL